MFNKKIISKRFEVNASASPTILTSVFGPTSNKMNGYLKQVVIYKDSGAATTVGAFFIVYELTQEPIDSIYGLTSTAFNDDDSIIDSNVDAPFSLLDPSVAGGTSYNQNFDLQIYIQTDAACVVKIRLDFEVY